MEFLTWWQRRRRYVARYILYWLAFFFLAVADWLYEHFSYLALPQLLSYLFSLRETVVGVDDAYLFTFFYECILAPTLVSSLMIAVELFIDTPALTKAALGKRFNPHSWLGRLIAATRRAFPMAAAAISLLFLLSQLSTLEYVKSLFGEDLFAAMYVPPTTVKLEPKELKNLVLIYVESLEGSYSDADIFGQDLLKDLNAFPGASFGEYLPAGGTGWTMGGIIGTQCGIPLQFVYGTDRLENGEHVELFLPNATCLGDILASYGYHNVFLGGANLVFAGKGRFFKQHHYHEVYGKYDLLNSDFGLQDEHGWGVHDDDLFQIAKAKLVQLERSGQLFNLNMLTVDTHAPDGFYSKLCIKRGAANYQDIIKCTADQVRDFLEFAQSMGFMKNTNFVVIGDHLSMPNPVYEELRRDPNRRIFNKFVATSLPPKNRETIMPFDMFPTILEFIGIRVKDRRLALGVSAFFEGDTMRTKFSYSDAALGRLNFSKTYQSLWKLEPNAMAQ